jgi:hypothetical protein
MAAEEVVLVARGAAGALQAADKKDGNANRHDDGESIRVDRKPVKQTMHDR